MNFKEFFIDYKDNLNEQKFIYYSGILNKREHEFKYSNNEEKIGWYHIQKNVMFQEKPFISSILLEYIVYDKKTKKVKFKLLNEKNKSIHANNSFKQYFLKSVYLLFRLAILSSISFEYSGLFTIFFKTRYQLL